MVNANRFEENQMTARMGVRIASLVLGITQVSVDFIDIPALEHSSNASLFLPDKYLILFNKLWIESAEMAEILSTSFHETRHAYQKLNIDFDKQITFTESKETIQKWAENFASYNKPQITLSNDYLKQSIEIDAVAFSHYMMYHLFKTKTVIPEEIKKEVLELVNKFTYKLPETR